MILISFRILRQIYSKICCHLDFLTFFMNYSDFLSTENDAVRSTASSPAVFPETAKLKKTLQPDWFSG